MLPPVPTLQTERLRLRGHRLDDFGPCAAMWADPTVTRHIGGKPSTEEESWTRLLRYVGHWAMLGFGYWVVEEQATGGFVGEIGFANYKRDLALPFKDNPEAGWAFISEIPMKKAMPPRPFALLPHGVTNTSDQPEHTASLLLIISRRFVSPRSAAIGNFNSQPTRAIRPRYSFVKLPRAPCATLLALKNRGPS